ncbi:MAG: GNAT family N-acetyltransferase [Oligoflexia bacterium]|nr:GNAT family N-acetyltransferase [Oligoflexia bacterium]
MAVFKECVYQYEVFLDNYMAKSPISLGDKDAFRKEREEEYKQVEDFFTDDFVKGFIDWVKEGYPSVEVDDLKPKCFEIEGVGPFLIGQRFKNGDRNMPFIILMIGFSEEYLSQYLEKIKKLARESFPKINPLGLTTTIRFEEELSSRGKVWNQIVFGKYEGDSFDSKYELIPTEPMDYSEYTKIYEEWGKTNPQVARFVSKESEEDLADAAKNNLYFRFNIDGEFAGIICAEEDSLYGHDSIYIFEELIFEKFRGQGLATIMQKMFHLKFPHKKYVWGHILHENQSSLKTALACNRRVLEREVFFPF